MLYKEKPWYMLRRFILLSSFDDPQRIEVCPTTELSFIMSDTDTSNAEESSSHQTLSNPIVEYCSSCYFVRGAVFTGAGIYGTAFSQYNV